MMWSCTEMPSEGGDIDDRLGHLDVGLRRRGGVFGDKTLRMNDASGATLDIIELLALLTPTVN